MAPDKQMSHNATNPTQKEKEPVRRAKTKLKQRKRAMLEALRIQLGNVTGACNQVGIDRRTHYRWVADDPVYKQQVEELPEVALDFVENALMKNIKKGVPSAQIFYLKTKGKARGYIEKQEIEHSTPKDTKFEVEVINVVKKEDENSNNKSIQPN